MSMLKKSIYRGTSCLSNTSTTVFQSISCVCRLLLRLMYDGVKRDPSPALDAHPIPSITFVSHLSSDLHVKSSSQWRTRTGHFPPFQLLAFFSTETCLRRLLLPASIYVVDVLLVFLVTTLLWCDTGTRCEVPSAVFVDHVEDPLQDAVLKILSIVSQRSHQDIIITGEISSLFIWRVPKIRGYDVAIVMHLRKNNVGIEDPTLKNPVVIDDFCGRHVLGLLR